MGGKNEDDVVRMGSWEFDSLLVRSAIRFAADWLRVALKFDEELAIGLPGFEHEDREVAENELFLLPFDGFDVATTSTSVEGEKFKLNGLTSSLADCSSPKNPV